MSGFVRLATAGCVACLLYVPLTASGAEPSSEEPIQTPDVVITATKTPVPITHVTSAVEVISGRELEEKKIKTVIDALRLAQGLFAFSSGGPGTLANVRMRGAQSKHTMVLIDGVIANSPTDGAFNFASLTTENIERIEILRGSQSMLYGSDAVGGVINIITKRGVGRPTASGFIEYGSFSSLREGAQASGSKGPVDFAFSLSRWDITSFSAANYKRGADERDPFHNWQASGRVGVALPRDARLELMLRWWNSDSHFDGTNVDVYGSRATERNLMLSGSYEQALTQSWSQKLTLAQTNAHFLSVGGSVQRNLTTGIVGPAFPFTSDIEILNRRLEWQHNVQVGKPLLLTAGYQFREEQADAPTSFAGSGQNNRVISTHAGFAQAQVNIQDRLFMTAGIRQDSYNVFGNATTYRVTAGYLHRETGTKFRSSYATGFRAPTLNDLFFQGANNLNLNPEKSQSLDAGVDQTLFGGRLVLSAGYFWNRFRDLIIFQSSPLCPPSSPFGCPVNVGLAKSQGWELGFKAPIWTWLEAHGQYTMTLTKDLSSGQTTSGRRLPRQPIDMASVGVTIKPVEAARINVDYRFVGERFNDATNTAGGRQGDFGVVNVSATYDVTKRLEVFGRIDNLLNQDYEEVQFFGTPIRSVYGGVKMTF